MDNPVLLLTVTPTCPEPIYDVLKTVLRAKITTQAWEVRADSIVLEMRHDDPDSAPTPLLYAVRDLEACDGVWRAELCMVPWFDGLGHMH